LTGVKNKNPAGRQGEVRKNKARPKRKGVDRPNSQLKRKPPTAIGGEIWAMQHFEKKGKERIGGLQCANRTPNTSKGKRPRGKKIAQPDQGGERGCHSWGKRSNPNARFPGKRDVWKKKAR